MNIRRLNQVLKYGWQDAKTISHEPDVAKGRIVIFCDILHCFLKFNVWSDQYKREQLYLQPLENKLEVCLKYQKNNTYRELWVKSFFDNRRWLKKWSSFKYDLSAGLQKKRDLAYQKKFGLGDNCRVGYNVMIQRHHYIDAVFETGTNCHIRENSDIDYTGGLIFEDSVEISEGVKILTHNHELDKSGNEITKGCVLSPLIIRDHVWIGTRATIMPGVKEIGRRAIISANAFVNARVPPYAIVMGNPAKVVGFRLLPKLIVELERTFYQESDRISLEVLERNYDKYYKSRKEEIKNYLK